MYCPKCELVRPKTHMYCYSCGSLLKADHQDEHLWAVSEFEIQKHNDSRLEDLKDFVQQDPENPYAQKALGDALFHLGKLVEAESHYRLAIEIDPENIDLIYSLSIVLYYQARINEALRYLKKVLKANPNYSAAHYRIGLAYYHLGKFDQAVEHLQKCATLTPDYEMAHYHAGVVYAKMGRRREAIREFGHELDNNLKDAACRLHLEALFEAKEGERA